MMIAKRFLDFLYSFLPKNSQAKDGKWLPFSAGLLGMVYLSYVSTGFIFLPKAEAESSKARAGDTVSHVPADATPDFSLISEWHLLGQAVVNTAAAANLSETQLQLKLMGVFQLTQPAVHAYAIIQAEDGVQKKYKPGDQLPGGATVQVIKPFQVVLLHNNRQETLSLEKNTIGLLDAAE
jgi:general secretion pathway protein C